MNKKRTLVKVFAFIFLIICPIVYPIAVYCIIQKFAIFEASSQVILMLLCPFFLSLFIFIFLIGGCKSDVEKALMLKVSMFLLLFLIGIAEAIILERSDDYAKYTKSLIKQSEFEECRYFYHVFKSTTENTTKALKRINNSIKESELNAVRERNDHKQELNKFKNAWKEVNNDGTKKLKKIWRPQLLWLEYSFIIS